MSVRLLLLSSCLCALPACCESGPIHDLSVSPELIERDDRTTVRITFPEAVLVDPENDLENLRVSLINATGRWEGDWHAGSPNIYPAIEDVSIIDERTLDLEVLLTAEAEFLRVDVSYFGGECDLFGGRGRIEVE